VKLVNALIRLITLGSVDTDRRPKVLRVRGGGSSLGSTRFRRRSRLSRALR
jgi:hypothetical protein